jgi:putative membrane protein
LRRIILRWAIIAVGVVAAAYWLPQYVSYAEGDWRAVIAFAAILGVLNAFVRPIVKLLTCPLQILTFGLFTLVVNALMFWSRGRSRGGLCGRLSGGAGRQRHKLRRRSHHPSPPKEAAIAFFHRGDAEDAEGNEDYWLRGWSRG